MRNRGTVSEKHVLGDAASPLANNDLIAMRLSLVVSNLGGDRWDNETAVGPVDILLLFPIALFPLPPPWPLMPPPKGSHILCGNTQQVNEWIHDAWRILELTSWKKNNNEEDEHAKNEMMRDTKINYACGVFTQAGLYPDFVRDGSLRYCLSVRHELFKRGVWSTFKWKYIFVSLESERSAFVCILWIKRYSRQ